MSQAETEAEALLRAGALYPLRSGLYAADACLIFFGIKHSAVSLYFGNNPSYHFDLEGRWLRCFVDPSHFLRRLDGSTQAIDRPRVGEQMMLDRRTLGEAEAASLDEAIRSRALDLAGRIASGELAIISPPPPARVIGTERLQVLLDRIARWDSERWADHRRRFAATYRSLPFLPPDSQDALILQATVPPGKGGAPVPRSPDEFAEHCRGVAELLGDRIVPYRNLFLAGPDVLRRPVGEAETFFRIASDVFPLAGTPAPARKSDLPVELPHRDGFHAFVGGSEGPPPAPSSWPRFRSCGLRRVSFGLAIGSPGIADDQLTPRLELPELVLGARSAGIPVSVVIRVGSPPSEERAEVVSLLRSLGPGKGDHVYLVEDGDADGASASLRDDLAPLRRESGVKVLPYNLRKQGL